MVEKFDMNNLYYINFLNSDSSFSEIKNKLLSKYSSYGFNCISYSEKDFDDDFIQKNYNILKHSRGFGYWIWKPYIILKTMNIINYGDVVLYTDCGDDVLINPKNFILEKTKDFFIISNVFRNIQYTKMDCFVGMGCNSDKYYESNHVEAGICAFKKSENTINFITEWLTYCSNIDIISDSITLENSREFIEHRHDQSILSNLVIKYDIPTIDIKIASKFFRYNNFF